ncbi:hypothetical protein Y032_0030g2116 [Ancylostoma ceylanicum]|uniref:Uncharacterized protein n=1 Tax=Ancylostoma ceylanicum TaxID=53326 RepID=A0A016UQV9_9BILA|nr:hypothetical protein Y032_0030g2116 [Ancylostoma ceylanicum]
MTVIPRTSVPNHSSHLSIQLRRSIAASVIIPLFVQDHTHHIDENVVITGDWWLRLYRIRPPSRSVSQCVCLSTESTVASRRACDTSHTT